jgi:hypothetical protein
VKETRGIIVDSRKSLTGTSLGGKVTDLTRERKVTPLVVTKQEELIMETRQHVSTITEYIRENVNINLVINVAERGTPRVIVVSRLFAILIESRATSRLIARVLIVLLMLTRGKEPVPPRITPVCL